MPHGSNNPLAADLDHVLAHARDILEGLRGARLFISGGTGFFGCWLLESFLWANERLNLNASAHVLTRDAGAFRRKAPHLGAHPAITLWNGDVCSFEFPRGEFSHVIHAATPASVAFNLDEPLAMLDTVVEGTRRTLELAKRAGARKFLLTSSGAVYGRQPEEITYLSEDYPGAPDPTDKRAAYGEGKRVAEFLCSLAHHQDGLDATIARCFAFVGPHLPLDGTFAIGNFVRDGLNQTPISIGGDGTPRRSYLYASDLMIWLWTILERGTPARPYNVGSDEDLSIVELARVVASRFSPAPEVRIAKAPEPNARIERYVPSTQRAGNELGLKQTVSLTEGLDKTLAWIRATGGAA